MYLQIAKMYPDVIMPSKRNGDGCYDIYAHFEENQIVIWPHTTALIPTGIRSTFDKEWRVSIRERGSNTKSYLQVMAGQIDSNYTGEWFVALHNCGDVRVAISKSHDEYKQENGVLYVPYSKAIAQFACEEIPCTIIKEVSEELIDSVKTERGRGNLGSSGK